MSNWVERRLESERLLRSQAPTIWENARAAVQDACESYNKLRADVVFVPENGLRCRISRRSGDSMRIVRLAFDKVASTITIVRDEEGPAVFPIRASDTSAFLTGLDGREISADEFSQIALEQLLFPGPRVSPINYRQGQAPDEEDD